jgi:hypothetical protein
MGVTVAASVLPGVAVPVVLISTSTGTVGTSVASSVDVTPAKTDTGAVSVPKSVFAKVTE